VLDYYVKLLLDSDLEHMFTKGCGFTLPMTTFAKFLAKSLASRHVRAAVRALLYAKQLSRLYRRFPASLNAFEKWFSVCNRLWRKVLSLYAVYSK